MTPQYESTVLKTFFSFYENGFVYKGLRAVYWCMHDETALAEAEVEYENHTSPTVWVKYKLIDDPTKIDAALAGKKLNTIIWTTTPWTLPASMAVAFHPDEEYVALESGGEVYIVASKLAADAAAKCGLADPRELAHFPGRKLERLNFQHPFLDRKILGVLADYVTMDTGTGVVHTAPSHGAEDFMTGVKYGLDATSNVDEKGILRNGLPEYDGKRVWDANQPILDLVKSRGALLHSEKTEHSYPHCWRCHNPVIFRATEQWFISMETPMPGGRGKDDTLRTRTLTEIKKVKWDPAWGEERLSNMIQTRPDWCISRQRVWGVPIAVFLCESCGKPLNDPPINKKVIELFASKGADAWFTIEPDNIVPVGTKCPHCPGTKFEKETDIFDVWLESGASYLALVAAEPEYPVALRPLPRRRRPVPRMVPVFPALRHGHAWHATLQKCSHARLDARRERPGYVEIARQRRRSRRHRQPPGRRNRPPLDRQRGFPRRRSRLRSAHAACRRKLQEDSQYVSVHTQ